MTTLSSELIQTGLSTQVIGRPVQYFEQIDSTSNALKKPAERGRPEGMVAIADEQTAGRGRLDRTWEAPPGTSLLSSILFRPAFLPPDKAQQLTMICALAAVEAIQTQTGVQVGIKWPNDLMYEGRKLAGVLTDLSFAADRIEWAIVGMGLNVNILFDTEAKSLDDRLLARDAISLQMITGRPAPRLPLFRAYLRGVDARYADLRRGVSPVADWAARLITLNRPVKVTTPAGPISGLAAGLDETGALLVQRDNGQVSRVLAGDVTLRRP